MNYVLFLSMEIFLDLAAPIAGDGPLPRSVTPRFVTPCHVSTKMVDYSGPRP
jgi:hypothetical protein